jgi:hypothetical protein
VHTDGRYSRLINLISLHAFLKNRALLVVTRIPEAVCPNFVERPAAMRVVVISLQASAGIAACQTLGRNPSVSSFALSYSLLRGLGSLYSVVKRINNITPWSIVLEELKVAQLVINSQIYVEFEDLFPYY